MINGRRTVVKARARILFFRHPVDGGGRVRDSGEEEASGRSSQKEYSKT